MPRQTFKLWMLKQVYENVSAKFKIYCLIPRSWKERKRLEEDVEELVRIFQYLDSKRYIDSRQRRSRPVNKFAIDLHHLAALNSTVQLNPAIPWLNEIEFLNAYRMTKSAFWKLVRAIQDNPLFSRKRGPKQEPVAHQLMVLLHYLGIAGSGGSNHRCRNHFHIGYGTVSAYKKRVIRAIRESLRASYYSWPSTEEKQLISAEIQKHFLLPNCVGAMDGTTFRLMTKPERNDASDFKGRKDGYTISGVFVFDHKKRIRYYNTGWAGSAHENRIFINCALYRNAQEYFAPNEYFVGDSALQEEPFCIPTYRAPTGGSVTGTKEHFNTVVGRFRVVSENGFGHLKGRFPILSSIPLKLTHDDKSMWSILELIDTCVILQNFIITHNEHADEPFFYTPRKVLTVRDPVGPLPDNDELNQPLAQNVFRVSRREQLRAYLSVNNLI